MRTRSPGREQVRRRRRGRGLPAISIDQSAPEPGGRPDQLTGRCSRRPSGCWRSIAGHHGRVVRRPVAASARSRWSVPAQDVRPLDPSQDGQHPIARPPGTRSRPASPGDQPGPLVSRQAAADQDGLGPVTDALAVPASWAFATRRCSADDRPSIVRRPTPPPMDTDPAASRSWPSAVAVPPPRRRRRGRGHIIDVNIPLAGACRRDRPRIHGRPANTRRARCTSSPAARVPSDDDARVRTSAGRYSRPTRPRMYTIERLTGWPGCQVGGQNPPLGPVGRRRLRRRRRTRRRSQIHETAATFRRRPLDADGPAAGQEELPLVSPAPPATSPPTNALCGVH